MSEELKARIVGALTALSDGEGATIRALRASQDLITLESVIADASGNGLESASLEQVATTLRRFLVEAANSLEAEPSNDKPPNASRAALFALGLQPGSEGLPYKAVKGRPGRQLPTARWLDTARTRVDKPRSDGTIPRVEVIDRVATQLLLRENEYLIGQRQLVQRARREPLQSAMRVEWLGRFERYFKMYTPLSGVYRFLRMAVGTYRGGDNAELPLREALHCHAWFLTELDDFTKEAGGLWMLPDIRTENHIADSNWYLRRETRLTGYDESRLRTAFRDAPELAAFVDLLESGHPIGAIAERWRDWAQSCRCARLARPRRDCSVHAAIGWCLFYMDALEAQWDFLADWYARPRSGSDVDKEAAVIDGKVVFPPQLALDAPRNSG